MNTCIILPIFVFHFFVLCPGAGNYRFLVIITGRLCVLPLVCRAAVLWGTAWFAVHHQQWQKWTGGHRWQRAEHCHVLGVCDSGVKAR